MEKKFIGDAKEMGEKENNHYVPQFYLKLFSNDANNIKNKDKKFVGSYLIEHKKNIEMCSIKDTANKKFLYGNDNKIENQLAKFEGEWANLVDKIIQTGEIPKSKVIYTQILRFFFLSDTRTSYLNDYFNNFMDNMQMLLQDIPSKRKEREEIRESCAMFKTYFEDMDKYLDLMSDLKIILIKNDTPEQFITSDCIMVKYNKLLTSIKYIVSYDYGQLGFQSFIPISTNYCLCLIDTDVYKIRHNSNELVIITNPYEAKELNKMFVYNSDKQLFHKNIDEKKINYYLSQKKIAYKDTIKVPFKKGKYTYIPFNLPGVYKQVNLPFFIIKDEYLKKNYEIDDHGPLRPRAEKILKGNMI